MDYWDMFTEFEQARAKRDVVSIFLSLHLTSIYLFVSLSRCLSISLSRRICILTSSLLFFFIPLFLHLYISLCHCFSISLSFHLSVFPSLCLFINLSFHLSVFPYLCLSTSLSFHLSSLHLSVFKSICRSIWQFLYLSIFRLLVPMSLLFCVYLPLPLCVFGRKSRRNR